jgi:methionine-rich copper-binding protein CopC
MRDCASSRIHRLLLAPGLLLLAAVPLWSPGLALAHAHYDHSTPTIGQVVAAAPARVEIFTDSDMRKTAGANVIAVTAADGSRVDDGTTVLDDTDRRHFSVGLNPNPAPGRYVVAFQTLSDADGDADHGRFAFYIGSGPTPQQQALDAGLNGAPAVAPTATAPSGASAFGPPAAILAGAVLLLLIAAGTFLALRRRQHRSA